MKHRGLRVVRTGKGRVESQLIGLHSSLLLLDVRHDLMVLWLSDGTVGSSNRRLRPLRLQVLQHLKIHLFLHE